MTSPISNYNSCIESYDNSLHKKDKVIANSIEIFFVTISTRQCTTHNDRAETVQDIYKYEIRDSKSLIDLAKKFIQSNGELSIQDDKGKISQCIQNYGIKSEDIRIHLAEAAVQNNPIKTSQYIKNYKITDQEALIRIAELTAQSAGWEISLNTFRTMVLQVRKA